MTLPLCHITNAFIRFREGVGHFYQQGVLLPQLVNASLCQDLKDGGEGGWYFDDILPLAIKLA